MNPESQVTNIDIDENVLAPNRRSPSWGAIFAGATAGFATHLLLMMLGTAAGLGLAQPATADNPVAGFGIATALVWTISALISLFVGGWVAGRYAARGSQVTGCVHGFMVWCLATVLGFLLLATGTGALVGGATRIAGEGISGMGKATSGLADAARQATQRWSGSLDSMVQEVAEAGRGQNGVNVPAMRREVGDAVRTLFREGGNPRDPEARAALVRALRDSAGMSEAEANQTIERWTASTERLRTELERTKQAAEAKAREVADKASRGIAKAALWSFIGFVIGAAAAAWGGLTGARWEYRHEPRREHTIDTAHGAMPGHA
jgi:hypothetical protein